MFGQPSTSSFSNHQRTSSFSMGDNTLKPFGATTTPTSFGVSNNIGQPTSTPFGTSNTTSTPLFAQSNNNTGLFGSMNTANNTNNSLFGASTTTNNNNNNNNSLFGASTSSTNNNSLFGTSFNSTPVNNSSLNGTTSTSAPFSATTTTSNTSTPFASNTLTSNTFGTANNTFGTGNTTFGASNNTFGINNNTLGTSNNNTFGTGSNNNTFGTSNNNNTFGTNNSFGQFTNNTTTNNTQASQPKEDLLSLKNCFGDNQVSHFLVKPDGIKRTTVPPSFFLGGNTRDVNYLSRQSKEKESNDGRINSLLTFGEEKKKVLPGFLTSSSSSVQNSLNDPSMNKISGLKRPISDIPNEERHVVAKTNKGVFSSNSTKGFTKNSDVIKNQLPPTESMRDVGINLSNINNKYQTDKHQPVIKPSIKSGDRTGYSVRVFGYTPDLLQKVIDHFSSLGDFFQPTRIQTHWVVFHYVTKEAATKAINCNGMLMNQHIIGVMWDERSNEIERMQVNPPMKDLYKSQSSVTVTTNPPNHTTVTLKRQTSFLNTIRDKLLGW